jgi:hypothetical protein
MGSLKIKKTLFVMHDKDRNDRLKFKTNLLQKMLMTTLHIEDLFAAVKRLSDACLINHITI